MELLIILRLPQWFPKVSTVIYQIPTFFEFFNVFIEDTVQFKREVVQNLAVC